MLELDRWIGAALTAMSLLVAGCEAGAESGGPGAPSDLEDAGKGWLIRLVGAVAETDVRVAVLLGKGKSRLYFCGGPQTYETTTRWFNVWYDGGEHVDFQEQNWRVHAHLTQAGLTGEVELGDGVTRTVEAELLTSASVAGLYEGKADCGRVGLIVSHMAKDALPTAAGACIDPESESVQPVSAIAPITSEKSEIRVRIPGARAATLLLQAATLDPL